MTVTYNIIDFRRQIAEFSGKMQARVFRAGVRAAGRVFLKPAIANAPVLQNPEKSRRRLYGALKANIYLGRPKKQPRGGVRMVVSVRSGEARDRVRGINPWYWKFLEGGWIPTGPKRVAGGKASRRLFRKRNQSRKILDYRFIRPAWDANQGQAIRAFEDAAQKAIDRLNKEVTRS